MTMNNTSVADAIKYVYVPEGSETLFADFPPAVQSAALEIIALIAAKPGVRCNVAGTGSFEGTRARFGRIGGRGGQKWVWSIVIDRLKALGVIEVDSPAIKGEQCKGYALTLAWSVRPLVRAPENSGRKPVALRESAKPIPRWALACLEAATFDVSGAVRCRLVSLGIEAESAAQLAADLDFNAIRNAIRAHAVARVPEAERGEVVTVKRGSQVVKLTRAEHAGNAAAARFTSEFKPLWRWRVDAPTSDDQAADARAWRDPSAFRLHSPITQLSSDLRPFLGFGGLDPADSGLVQIDARNAQAVFLAALVADKLPGSDDARRFLEVCGAGRFYEETFRAMHGRDFDPDKRVKYRKPRRTPDPETGRMFSVQWGSERDAWKRRIMGAWLYGEADTQVVSAEGQAIGGDTDIGPHTMILADGEVVIDDVSDDADGLPCSGLWPDVHAYILGRKREWKPDEVGALRPAGARALPLEMQRAESTLWVDSIVPALERAGIPVWTIHDSAIVPAARAADALAVIQAAYETAGYLATFGTPETIREGA